MPNRDSPRARFRKSTYSDGGEGCVEAATLNAARLVRDSKDPDGPTLAFTPAAWTSFLDQIKQGRFDPA
ncbi:DUF397 domain-containing protein [Actinomadura sp. DC4]|uniref:DUF397 domain-containing protein n=1 Tax=Actinomadura sp. DC4 TaxID=3055069 RepID=UPI0025B07049|nr:DUF397 domain-containing protein [Actinomadura sp. DC4]MDN3359290.1 DUF397 domain-containing protein [Actinomadura sp. DC4]